MTFKNLTIVTILAAALILGGIFAARSQRGSGNVGGAQLIENSNPIFTNGLRGGGVSTAIVQVVNSAGQWVGQLSTALSATFTGTTRMLSPVETGSKIIFTAGTSTSPTAAQICGASYIEFQPTVAVATATLPTAAALTSACLTTTGDRLPYIVWKNTAASASTTVFAAGASTTLVYQNATTTVGGAPATLNGGSYASLRFFSASSSDPTSGITVLISQFK